MSLAMWGDERAGAARLDERQRSTLEGAGSNPASRSITIRVHGNPAPQGSKRFMGTRGGKGILLESSKAVKPWREAVKAAAYNEHPLLLDGPLEVEMTFTVAKPSSAPKRRRIWPRHAPDLSKLVRSTEDALTDAGVFTNDARIVRCLAAKVFPNEGDDALPLPGAIIRVAEIVE